MSTPDRTRLRLAVTVEFRTQTSFLVAYSSNLSQGGLFVATDMPTPPGELVSLVINVPGCAPMSVTGRVVWVRAAQSGPEQPAGMGIQLNEPVDATYGQVIDRLVSAFRGLRVLLLASTFGSRSLLGNLVRRAANSAQLIDATDMAAAEGLLENEEFDVAVLDLVGIGPEGLYLVRWAQTAALRPTPVIVLTDDGAVAARARDLGADAVLPSPPAPQELTLAIVASVAAPKTARR